MPNSLFQSTLPARGATKWKYVYTYSEKISIHAPRTGSDTGKKSARNRQNHFNPRSPHGERPGWCALAILPRYFNPRSPHGERRIVALAISFHFIHFNPRSPHGERQGFKFRGIDDVIFQSTLPARGATKWRCWEKEPTREISIHAPRTGSDISGTPYKQTSDISIHAPRTGSD